MAGRFVPTALSVTEARYLFGYRASAFTEPYMRPSGLRGANQTGALSVLTSPCVLASAPLDYTGWG